MIHAERNGARQTFGEKEWGLLPKHKFGWKPIAAEALTSVPASSPVAPAQPETKAPKKRDKPSEV